MWAIWHTPAYGQHGARMRAHAARMRLQPAYPAPPLNSNPPRYFYAKLSLGTPPRTFSTIIDTGSTITYVACSDCKHCGKHMVSV